MSKQTISCLLQVDLGNRPDLNTAAPGDFYELLGLDSNADPAAVRAAYRALQRIVHPDIIGTPLLAYQLHSGLQLKDILYAVLIMTPAPSRGSRRPPSSDIQGNAILPLKPCLKFWVMVC